MISHNLLNTFKVPLIVLAGIIVYLVLSLLKLNTPALFLIIGVVVLGSYQLFVETFQALLKKQFALDYIAILAIVVAFITQEYLVAAIIALMISSGRTLEEYGINSAKKNLTKLADRIPDQVVLWVDNQPGEKEKIENIKVGQEIFIRKGEVIPLDGILKSTGGLTDESTLTGEPYTIEKITGDILRSGTVNIGETVVLEVTRAEKDSTYTKIIQMVQQAQQEKAPLIRLADRYSTIFTLITLAIAAFAYFYSHSIFSVLAVLVVATPCPLILATPIALLGGVNASAKKRIIVKRLSSLEALSKVKAIIFDKTGTITLGIPKVVNLEILDRKYSAQKILEIAQAIERNSLHPLAKAIVRYAHDQAAPIVHALNVKEEIGKGISGEVSGEKYLLGKLPTETGMAIALSLGNKQIATFYLEDQIKEDSQKVIKDLINQGFEIFIYTGDKVGAAEKVVEQLDKRICIQANCTPEDKSLGIKKLQSEKKAIAMIGDGINDAPALALADAGLVFSHEEQTAASEAADIVFLGGNFQLVSDIISISKKTVGIAIQSILAGIGISVIAMCLAAVGLIPPIFGAILQEAIDVAVIINALRASRIT